MNYESFETGGFHATFFGKQAHKGKGIFGTASMACHKGISISLTHASKRQTTCLSAILNKSLKKCPPPQIGHIGLFGVIIRTWTTWLFIKPCPHVVQDD